MAKTKDVTIGYYVQWDRKTKKAGQWTNTLERKTRRHAERMKSVFKEWEGG